MNFFIRFSLAQIYFYDASPPPPPPPITFPMVRRDGNYVTVAQFVFPRDYKGGQRGHPPYTPCSIGNSSRVIFRTADPKGDWTTANIARMYSAWTTHARATRPPRIDAEQNGGRRGERFCYSFCRRKRLQRDFCESCVSETEIKKESPFLSCIELTVQQGNP